MINKTKTNLQTKKLKKFKNVKKTKTIINNTSIHKSHINKSSSIPKKSWYEYPFGSIIDIHGYYRKCDIFTPIIGEKEKLSDAGNFPHNIRKYIWGEEGDNDFIEWILLCKLTNGKYAFYTAWCDYTGFDCQGGMKLYIASSINVLVKMAMNEIQRTKYNIFINTNIKHTQNINKL